MADLNIETIDLPYDSFLFRSDPTVAPIPNGNVETQPVKTEGSLNDIWIDTYLRSTNWLPKTRGFYIDGQTGYAEFSNVFVVGDITATTGNIGGWVINPTNLTSPLGQVVLDSANNKIIFYNNAHVNTITLDGSLTSAGEPQIRIGGGIYLSATADATQIEGGSIRSYGAGVATIAIETTDPSGNVASSLLINAAGETLFSVTGGMSWQIDRYGNLEIPSITLKTPDTIGTGFASNITPDYTNGRSIGSGSKYWNNAYINGTISIGGSIIPTGSLSAIGSTDYHLDVIWTNSLVVQEIITPVRTQEGKTIIGVPDVLGMGPITFQTVATHTVSLTGNSTDPVLDLQGTNYTYPDGAMYYNTISQKMKLKTGGTWVDITTGGGVVGANTALSNLVSTSINQSLVPNSGYTYTLGTNSAPWSYIYASALYSSYVNVYSVQINGTTVIDSSRNLTNIGDITANGTIRFPNESSGVYVNWLRPTGSSTQIGYSGFHFGLMYLDTLGTAFAKVVVHAAALSACPLPVADSALTKLKATKHKKLAPGKGHYGDHLDYLDISDAPAEMKNTFGGHTETKENGEKVYTEPYEDIDIIKTTAFLYSCMKEMHAEIEALKEKLAKKP